VALAGHTTRQTGELGISILRMAVATSSLRAGKEIGGATKCLEDCGTTAQDLRFSLLIAINVSNGYCHWPVAIRSYVLCMELDASVPSSALGVRNPEHVLDGTGLPGFQVLQCC